jgi:hypothetical protein
MELRKSERSTKSHELLFVLVRGSQFFLFPESSGLSKKDFWGKAQNYTKLREDQLAR